MDDRAFFGGIELFPTSTGVEMAISKVPKSKSLVHD